MSRAVIFVNGNITNLEGVLRLFREGDFLIAADGGTKHALALGLLPSIIIGDLDSLSEEEQAKVEAGGCKLVKYSRDKNETDFELALDFTIEAGYREILVAGALGGRLDQMLGNLSILSNDKFSGMDICADDGTEEVQFITKEHAIFGKAGDIVSLIPWGREVRGITTEGLRWPLYNETLQPDKTRGISNELIEDSGLVTLTEGLLLVIHKHD
jgi:thiamine pyrophosphokinase